MAAQRIGEYSPPSLCTALTRDPGYTVLWGLLMRYGLAQALFPVHTPYIFSSCSPTDSFFIDVLPSSLSCCERKPVCCLTKSHGLETWRLFRRYNGLVIPRLSYPSIFYLSPHHIRHTTLPSWFIVYSMIIIPFAPDFRALFLVLPESSLSRVSIASSPYFPIMTRSTKVIIGTHIATPSCPDHFRFQSHIPFLYNNSHGRIFLTYLAITAHISPIYWPSWIY
jgi:hypothetical protein